MACYVWDDHRITEDHCALIEKLVTRVQAKDEKLDDVKRDVAKAVQDRRDGKIALTKVALNEKPPEPKK